MLGACLKARWKVLLMRGNVHRRSHQTITIPDILDTKAGTVEKWLIAEGEEFFSGTNLCEVSLRPADLTIAVPATKPGILARIIVKNGRIANVDEPIALFVSNKDEYNEFLDEQRIDDYETDALDATKQAIDEISKKPDNKVLMREIRHLIKEGLIEDGSDFAKKLMSLARKSDNELMGVFEASFDGSSFNLDSFDAKFFVENAREIIESN